MKTLRVVGEFSRAIWDRDTFAQGDVYVGHTCDGRLILHLEDDIEGQALTIDGWDIGTEIGIREALDDVINALIHCTCLVFTAKGDHRGNLQINGTEPLKLILQQVAVAL
jgi:hypothetical protein